MSNKKWTLIDTLIVLLVIVAGVALVKVFGTASAKGDTKTVCAVVLLAKEDPVVKDAITIGDTVTISLTEKDSGILKDVRVEDATELSFNAIEGKYAVEPIEGKVDIFATVELEVVENDYGITCGSSVVKVGEKMPFRGKGYALEGFVVEITE